MSEFRQQCPTCEGFGAIMQERMAQLDDSANSLPPVEYVPCPSSCESGWITSPPC